MQKGVASINVKEHLQAKLKQLRRNLERYMDLAHKISIPFSEYNFRPLEARQFGEYGEIDIKKYSSYMLNNRKRDEEYTRNKIEYYRIKIKYKIELLKFEMKYIERLLASNIAIFMTTKELRRYKMSNKVENDIDYIVKPECKPKYQKGQIVWFIAEEETDCMTKLKTMPTIKEGRIDKAYRGYFEREPYYLMVTTGVNWLLYPHEKYLYKTRGEAIEKLKEVLLK